MIRIRQAGAEICVPPVALSRLRDRFERRHFIALPGFLAPGPLALVLKKLESCAFRDCAAPGGFEARQKPADGAAGAALRFLLNDRRLFDFVEAVTGAGPIGGLTGDVFRTIPGAGHRLDWHQDLDRGGQRAAAMTINLSPKPVRGGLLQLRTHPEGTPLGEIPYARAGEAVIFRLRKDVAHRSSELEGSEPKTIFTAWFLRSP